MVLGREGAQAFDLRGTLREQFSRFGEEFFEPRRRDDFHQTGHFVGRIPERVRDSAWLQDVIPRTRQENLVADSSAELTLHDVGILIRVMVQMRWNESSRLDGMLHDGKRSVGLVAGDFELDPESTHRNKLAFFRRNRQTAMVLLSPIHSNRRARASSNPDDKFLRAGDAAMSSRRGTSRNKDSAPAGEARPCQRRGLTPQGRGTTAPGSYVQVFLFGVPKANHDSFAATEDKLFAIFRRHGILGSDLYVCEDARIFQGLPRPPRGSRGFPG